MRILFATIGEPSHLDPQVPLAWALISAGHEVRVASGPAMTDLIAAAGLPPVAVGEDHGMDELLRAAESDAGGSIENEIADWSHPFDESLTWPEVLIKYQASVPYGYQPYNDPILEGLVDFARKWQPDLVIWDPVTYAGAVAAEAIGAAHARLLWSVDIYSTMYRTWQRLSMEQPPEERHDPLRDWLTPALHKVGAEFSEEILTGQWTIDLVPDSLQFELETPRLPVRYVPFHTRRPAPSWIHEQPVRPRVALSGRGSLDAKLNSSIFPVKATIEALAEMDVEVVAVLSEDEREQLGTVPENIRLVDFVPFHMLLPTCSALIHHGGFGAASTAALNGVPQLLLPIRHADAWVRAEHLAQAGAGLFHHALEADTGTIRKSLTRLLEERSFREKAWDLQQQMVMTATPNDIVADLERLTHRHRRDSDGANTPGTWTGGRA